MALTFPANRSTSELPLNTAVCAWMRSDQSSEATRHGPLMEKIWSPAVLDASALISFKETTIAVDSQSFRSSMSSFRTKLPVVLEESESFSSRDGSSVEGAFSTSSSSFTWSSASSSRTFVRNGASTNNFVAKKGSKKARKYSKGDRAEKFSLLSSIFWPLRRLRDRYVSCMMGLDGNGDLSGLAQGSNFGASSRYFGDLPISKVDPKSYG